MCAQALPCRALKSWCIGQKSYCFKVQKNRIISLAKASTHPLPNIFKVLLSPKWYDFGKLLTLQVFDRSLKNCDLESMETISIKKFKLQWILHYYVRCTKQAYSYHICLSYTILFHQNMKCIVLKFKALPRKTPSWTAWHCNQRDQPQKYPTFETETHLVLLMHVPSGKIRIGKVSGSSTCSLNLSAKRL